MNKLKMLASQATSMSALMDGREKISTEDIIKTYGTITVTAVDMVKTSDSEYPVLTFKENPDAFYCGGVVLKKIVASWIEYFGTVEAVNEQLATDPVRLMLSEGKTKDGKNNVTKVTIVD